MATITQSALNVSDQALLDGLEKHKAVIPSFLLRGSSVPATDVVTVVQSRLDAASAVRAARATLRAAVAAELDQRTKTAPTIRGVRRTLHVAFEDQIDVLADFGMAPPKARVVAPGTKILAAAKAKATREARHTMGAQQKKAIVGDVTSITVTANRASPPATTVVPPPTSSNGAAPAAATTPRSP